MGFRAEKTTFPVHILTVKKSELKSELKYWDLCAFFSALKASSKDKKYEDKERPKVRTLGYTHLALDFKDESARVEFETAVWTARTLRQGQFKCATDARSVAETNAHTPTRTIHSETTSLRRISVAPKLPPMVRESTFSLDFVSISSARTYL
jgi:hypothetical protein